jgi:cell division protease FtsH
VNQLLSELDGFDEQKNKDLFLITATNYLKNIDAAVIRSGRFDRKVHIAFPSFADRVKILELHLKKISADPHIDSHAISSKLGDNFSGADIATLVNEAALTALRRNDSRVRTIHFEEVLKRWSKER